MGVCIYIFGRTDGRPDGRPDGRADGRMDGSVRFGMDGRQRFWRSAANCQLPQAWHHQESSVFWKGQLINHSTKVGFLVFSTVSCYACHEERIPGPSCYACREKKKIFFELPTRRDSIPISRDRELEHVRGCGGCGGCDGSGDIGSRSNPTYRACFPDDGTFFTPSNHEVPPSLLSCP